jgi:TonB family protein
MPPVALLFSSNEKASRPWTQALQELELTIEPCDDVFVAVEWLISKSFDVIVADCDSGPEAAFLLKNARDLKLNRAAFTLAIGNEAQTTRNQEISADQILAKQLTPEQIKYALLANDRFLSCMKAWIARGDLAVAQPASPSPKSGLHLVEQPSPTVLPTRPSPTPIRGRMEPRAAPHRKPGPPDSAHRHVLRTFILSVILVVLAYVFGNPLRVQSVFASLGSAYAHARQVSGIKLSSSEDDDALDSVAIAQPASDGAGKNLRVRVIPVYPGAVAKPSPITPKLDPSPAPLEESPEEAKLNPPSPETNHVQIPASLTTSPPVETDTDARPAIVQRPASLLGQVEPAALPEELSRKLLIERTPPSYPEQALKAGLQGAVVLQAWIAKDGSVRDLKLVDGSFLLGQAAVKAVKQWRYKPYLRNGVAVEAETYVTLNFKLP